MAETLNLMAELLHQRWRRAVDLLWRETVRRRQAGAAEWERLRSARRLRNLQKIVRKALSDYHRIELDRQDRNSRSPSSEPSPTRRPRH